MKLQEQLPGYRQYRDAIERDVSISVRMEQNPGPGIHVYNQTDSSAEILIYDEISPFGVSAKDVALQIQGLSGKLLTVRMNTPGGDVFDGIAIHSLLKSHVGGVHVVVDGIAASAGSLIAMAGDTIRMNKGSFMHVHNPWGLAIGDAKAFREFSEKLDKVQGVAKKIYAERTGLSQKSVQALMDSDEIMTSDEAVERGFADGHVVDSVASAKIDGGQIRSGAIEIRPGTISADKIQGFEAKSIDIVSDVMKEKEEENCRISKDKKKRQLELAMVR